MDPVKAKDNYSRVCQLLVNKGGDALRTVLHAKHPPSSLSTVLNANKKSLKKIRYSVIQTSQWKLLFPVSGEPDSRNFDITLLTILLRIICGLASPTQGWNIMPPACDTSISADIVRIRMIRNYVYDHKQSAEFNNATFDTMWQEISRILIKLGIPKHDINDLKVAPLSPERESYIQKLTHWKKEEDQLLSMLRYLTISKRCGTLPNEYSSEIDQLAKFDFSGKIDNLCKESHCDNGQWFFDKLAHWFHDVESRVLILNARPSVGKSVLCAKVCKLYQQRGQLAAAHFYDFSYSDCKNPKRILQSLASQMCDNIEGFRRKLCEVLCREFTF